jgi:AraC-like DNA-binding protein
MIRQKKTIPRHRQKKALPGCQATAPPEVDPMLNQSLLMSRIYALLNGHLHDSSVCVNWLAHQLVMNRKTLYRKVYSLSQLTPTALIRAYRLRKAAELLCTGCTVTRTASSTGFKTLSHFTTVFKEFHQQTPTQFIASRVQKV